MKITWSEPGVPLSAAFHVGLLLATFLAFSSAPNFEEQPESIAVEMITADELTKLTKGDKTVKTVKPEPKVKVDKVAEQPDVKPDSGEASPESGFTSGCSATLSTLTFGSGFTVLTVLSPLVSLVSSSAVIISTAIDSGCSSKFGAEEKAFSSAPNFEEQPESIAVEMITADELTKLTKGDKTVKTVKPEPKVKVDKVAEQPDVKPDSGEASPESGFTSGCSATLSTLTFGSGFTVLTVLSPLVSLVSSSAVIISTAIDSGCSSKFGAEEKAKNVASRSPT